MSALVVPLTESNPVKQNAAINRLGEGGSNAVGSFTLAANATSTTVSSPTCSPSSYVFLSPQTAHAANDMATTWATAGTKQFVVTHANNARVDRTFGFAVFG